MRVHASSPPSDPEGPGPCAEWPGQLLRPSDNSQEVKNPFDLRITRSLDPVVDQEDLVQQEGRQRLVRVLPSPACQRRSSSSNTSLNRPKNGSTVRLRRRYSGRPNFVSSNRRRSARCSRAASAGASPARPASGRRRGTIGLFSGEPIQEAEPG